MQRFNRLQIKELKNFLYYSNIHDSRIVAFRYDRKQRLLTIETFNPIYAITLVFIFKEVKVVLSIRGRELDNYETILSLTVEEDCLYLRNCVPTCNHSFDDSLYVLFQMLSGDELHVVSNEIFVTQSLTGHSSRTGDGGVS